MIEDRESDPEEPNKNAAGEDVKSPLVTLRILAKGEETEDQKFWIERLKEYGADIISASSGGIVAEGPMKALEKALDVSMEMDGETPMLRQETAVRSSGGRMPIWFRWG